jgi:hypothetical protein
MIIFYEIFRDMPEYAYDHNLLNGKEKEIESQSPNSPLKPAIWSNAAAVIFVQQPSQWFAIP